MGNHGRLPCNELWHLSITGLTAFSSAELMLTVCSMILAQLYLLQWSGDTSMLTIHCTLLYMFLCSMSVSKMQFLSCELWLTFIYACLTVLVINLIVRAPLRQVARTAMNNRECVWVEFLNPLTSFSYMCRRSRQKTNILGVFSCPNGCYKIGENPQIHKSQYIFPSITSAHVPCAYFSYFLIWYKKQCRKNHHRPLFLTKSHDQQLLCLFL